MIIKVKQTQSYANGVGVSVNIGKKTIYESDNKGIAYEAFINDTQYGKIFLSQKKIICICNCYWYSAR